MGKSTERLRPRFRSRRVRCLGCKRPGRGRPALNLPGLPRQRPQGGPAARPPSAGRPQLPGRFQGSPRFCGSSLREKGASPGRPTRAASAPRLESAPPGSLPRTASCQPQSPEGHPNSKVAPLSLSPHLQEHTTPRTLTSQTPDPHTCKSLSFPHGGDGLTIQTKAFKRERNAISNHTCLGQAGIPVLGHLGGFEQFL
uniref:Uncharacterized protein n=1 Tax=Myotis myotis TaxID=51298 RepID=A0A7J7WW45_MYOMY|nr:hypothetical protein mMyoMyo1_011944 [Myotis myotis]